MHSDDQPDLETRILNDAFTSLAVSIGFDRGLFDRLRDGPIDVSPGRYREKGDALVFALLQRDGIVTAHPQGMTLSAEFAALLDARAEALRVRVRFHRMALADLMTAGDDLFYDLPRFMARSSTFRFFDYARAQTTKAAALEDTAGWVNYVSALTELEAAPLAEALSLEGTSTILEIGGNSGAFARALLARHPDLHITVLDLPGVCHLGVSARDTAGISPDRLVFAPGDARQQDWPKPAGRAADAVLFKSVLHDWDTDGVTQMLSNARAYLEPGGTVIICERGPLEREQYIGAGALAANLVFAPFYRDPSDYVALLTELGFAVAAPHQVQLDMTFNVIVARRGS